SNFLLDLVELDSFSCVDKINYVLVFPVRATVQKFPVGGTVARIPRVKNIFTPLELVFELLLYIWYKF
ncbi:MAG: hypothetical protein ACKO96_20190, partial [Flammeovirgaceae bacterium]